MGYYVVGLRRTRTLPPPLPRTGYGVPYSAIASRPRWGSGLGAFMWSDLRGLGQEDPTEGGECPEPVPTAERDALRNEIKGWTGRWEGPHFHENHPDVKAIFNDIVSRLSGLEKRPQLLRCKKEARDRANNWIGQLKDLQRRINKRGVGPGYQNASWVRIEQPFEFTVYRGPTYTVRAGTPHPEAFSGQPSPASPTGPTPSSAPAGSVVVNGQVYPSSAAAAAASSPAPVETTGGGGAWEPSPAAPSLLEGEVMGIPTRYLVLGAGALLAFRMMKGR